jgi:hypothetical protein
VPPLDASAFWTLLSRASQWAGRCADSSTKPYLARNVPLTLHFAGEGSRLEPVEASVLPNRSNPLLQVYSCAHLLNPEITSLPDLTPMVETED